MRPIPAIRSTLALVLFALALGCERKGPPAPPPPQVASREALTSAAPDAGPDVCAAVSPFQAAPGYLAGPISATSTAPAQTSFTASAGTQALLVLQNGDGHGSGEAQTGLAMLNGTSYTIAAGTRLSARIVTLAASDTLSLSATGALGSVRASLASLSSLPCPLAGFTTTRSTGGPQTVSRTFSWPDSQALGVLVAVPTGPNGTKLDLTLNGTQVLSSSTQGGTAAGAVTLAASNTLLASLTGKAGGSFQVTLLDADTLGPSLSISQPPPNQVVSSAQVAVSGSVGSDATQIKVGSNPVTPSAGQYSGSVTIPEGTSALVVSARDYCGNTVQVCEPISLDTTPPVITVTGVSANQVAQGPLTITYSAIDPHPGSVSATLDGAAFASGTPVSAEGDHHLVVTATDAAGNTATTSIDFALDRTPPEISVSGVSDGQVSDAGQIVPVYSASDLHPGSVSATLDGADFASGTPVTAEATHTLVVSAADQAGNPAQKTVTFTLDRTAPVISIGGVGEGERRNSPATLTYSATDPNLADVSATLDGASVPSGTSVSAAGTHTLQVTATDKAGNRATASRTFTIDLSPPLLVVTSPTEGYLTRQTQVEVAATASDDGPLASVSVGAVTLSPDGSGAYRGSVPLTEGTNLLDVLARDAAGNETHASRTVIRDSTAPVISLSQPQEGARIAALSVVVSGQVSDASGVQLTVAGSATPLGAGGAFSTTVPLVAGDNLIALVATDAAGNVAQLTRNVRANTTPPSLTLTTPTQDTSTDGAYLAVRGTASPADAQDSVSVTVNGSAVTVASDGTFATVVSLQLGSQTLSVQATDGYGLSTTASVQVTRTEPDAGSPTADAGSTELDAGTQPPTDAGAAPTDAGAPEVDAGTPAFDAGTPSDAGAPADAGSSAVDAGASPADAGPPSTQDAGTSAVDAGPSSSAPVIVLQTPGEGAVTNADTVSVTGSIQEGQAPFQVTVNGAAASVTGSSFAIGLTLAEGDQALSVQVTDALGRTASASRSISIDRTPPYLVLTRPSSNPAAVTERPYHLVGTVGDLHLAGVTVQGSAVDVVAGGFSADLPLSIGESDVRIVASDLAGNVSSIVQHFSLSGAPPVVTILSPAPGTASDTPEVSVVARVDSSSPLAQVTIGTGPASGSGGVYSATVPLALGDNAISVVATDTLGFSSTAVVHVSYRDPATEPLAVTGVTPAPGAQDVEPDQVISVSFNKPVDPATVTGNLIVSGPAGALAGRYAVAPGAQAVMFIAQAPLPTSARVRVQVSNVAAQTGPAMASPFTSDFLVRHPLTVVRGVVLGERMQPLAGVRVELLGKDRSVLTSSDGNWALVDAPSGPLTVRYTGPRDPSGQAYPAVERTLYATPEQETKDRPLLLIPADPASTQYLDGTGPLHLTLNGRFGPLAIDGPSSSLVFADGSTSGYASAAELPAYAVPVPVQGRAVLTALYQLSPQGSRLSQKVTLALPNRTQLPAGRLALFLAYDPSTHTLAPVGFGRVSADGQVVQTDQPVQAPSLELVGYMGLSADQSAAVDAALSAAGGGQLSPADGGFGYLLQVPVKEIWERALDLLEPSAEAQLIDMPAGMSTLDQAIGRLMPARVYGVVRSPRDRELRIDLSQPNAGSPGAATPQQVALTRNQTYLLTVSATATEETNEPTGTTPDSITLTLSGSGPNGVGLAQPQTSPAWVATGQGTAALPGSQVELSAGTSHLLLAAQLPDSSGRVELEAVLDTDGGTLGGAPAGLLTVTKVSDSTALDATAVGSPIRYQGLNVTITASHNETGQTGPTGGYGILITVPAEGTMGISCTDVFMGNKPILRDTPTGRHTELVPYEFQACSPTYSLDPGAAMRADILVDARLLYGSLSFAHRDGTPLEPTCSDTQTVRDPTTGEVSKLSVDDLSTTEVHFFREDDLTQPIAKYTVAVPSTLECGAAPTPLPGGGAAPPVLAQYTRVRLGPTVQSHRAARAHCQTLKGQAPSTWSADDRLFFQANCGDKSGNFLRLEPGDRLVAFAVNHASGFAGMSTVTVPPINQQAGLAADGSCPADVAAGGVEQVQDEGQTLPLSRCTRAALGIPINIALYPPEVDIRLARKTDDDPAGATPRQPLPESLIRQGGEGTTRDSYFRVDAHWRVRKTPHSAALDTYDPEDPDCKDGLNSDGSPCVGRLGDRGTRGKVLELYCSELPPTAPAALRQSCMKDDKELGEIPAGVPPLAGQLLEIIDSASAPSQVLQFPIKPGRATSALIPAVHTTNAQGQPVSLLNLPRANYYVHVVGNPMASRDLNGDGVLSAAEEAIPPHFEEPSPRGSNPLGLPKGALQLKNVYIGAEPDGTRLLRYDLGREHEARIISLQDPSATAQRQKPDGTTDNRDLTPTANASATEDDVSYKLTMALLEPDLAGRDGANIGSYVVRLGTDRFGEDCALQLDGNTHSLTANCGGDSLADIVSATDILYMELYQSGNAQNVLYRFNFNGLAARTDRLAAGSDFTADRAVAHDTPDGTPTAFRPPSEPNVANVFLGPADIRSGTVSFCTAADCSGDSLLKTVDLSLGAAGYALTDHTDGKLGKLQVELAKDLGVGGEAHFRLPMGPDLAPMPGSANPEKTVYVKVADASQAASGQVSKPIGLGKPIGHFDGSHARAPGQLSTGNINLADGHLSFTHQDFSLPEFGGALGFAHSYDNQSNELGALGSGWSHPFEGFVEEEWPGRYGAVLAGQTYDFTTCDSVDYTNHTAKKCASLTNGGVLDVAVDPSGDADLYAEHAKPALGLRMPDGTTYFFERLAVQANGAGRRRWMLTRIDDAHGDPGSSKRGIQLGYLTGTDLVQWVSRQPDGQVAAGEGEFNSFGKVRLDFTYVPVQITDQTARRVRVAARRFGFQYLHQVAATNVVTGATLYTVTFEQDPDKGQLKSASRDGSPSQAFIYDYESLPDGLMGEDAWRASNEVRQITLKVNGTTQYQATFRHPQSDDKKPFHHEDKNEIVDHVDYSGQLGSMDMTFGSGTRTVTRPDGVPVKQSLNKYGNLNNSSLPQDASQTGAWDSDDDQSRVVMNHRKDFSGRAFHIENNGHFVPNQLQLTELPFGDTLPVDGVSAGTLLRDATVDETFGVPTTTSLAQKGGNVVLSTPISAQGDPKGIDVVGADGKPALTASSTPDFNGAVTTETDPMGRTLTYFYDQNAWGQPDRVEIVLAGKITGPDTLHRALGYDERGRLHSVLDQETGAKETWSYDDLDRVKDHHVEGSPSLDEHYEYNETEGQTQVVQTILGLAGYQHTSNYESGLLRHEEFQYGGGWACSNYPHAGPQATAHRDYTYIGGRLDLLTDERGRVHKYHYDANGRLQDITVGGVTEVHNDVDSEGKVTLTRDVNKLETHITYDTLGREVRRDYGGGDVEEIVRDGIGAVVGKKFGDSGLKHKLTQKVDGLGRVTSEVSDDSVGGIDSLTEYDSAGRVVHTKDNVLGLDETFEYKDVLGRLTQRVRTVQPGNLTETETRVYSDAPGNRTVTIDVSSDTGGSGGKRTKHTVLTVDAMDRVLQRKETGADGSDHTAITGYDPLSRVTSATELDGSHAVQTCYDPEGRVVGKTDQDGNQTTYVTDEAGLVTDQYGPLSNEHWHNGYDDFRQLKSKDLEAFTSGGSSLPKRHWDYLYAFEGADSTVQETEGGTTWKRTTNARGHLLSEVMSGQDASRSTTTTWDGPFQASTTVTEGGWTLATAQDSIDDRGRVLHGTETWSAPSADGYAYETTAQYTGQNSHVVQIGAGRTSTVDAVVDSLGHTISRTQGGLTDTWVYGADGLLSEETPTGHPTTAYEYVQGLLTKATTLDEVTQYTYDANLRTQSISYPDGRSRYLHYFGRNLVKDETYGTSQDASHSEYSYDEAGNRATVSVSGGAVQGDLSSAGALSDAQTITYSYGPGAKLLSAQLPGSVGTFQYEYDARHRLKTITPPGLGAGAAQVQTFTYDDLDRVKVRTRGASTWTTNWADGTGTTLDPNNDQSVSILDGRGRLASRSYTPGPATSQLAPLVPNGSAGNTDLTGWTVTYDHGNRPVTVVESRNSSNVTTHYTYDDRDRLTVIDRGGERVTYDFGGATDDQVRTVSSPNNTVSYGYDAFVRLNSVSGPSGTQTIGWEPGGARLANVTDSRVDEQWHYFGRGLVQRVEHLASGSVAAAFEYGYDGRGNRLSEHYTDGLGADESTSYGYDEADRLTGVRYPGGEAHLYSLASDGSRLGEKVQSGYSSSLGTDAYSALTSADAELSYSYDQGGGISGIQQLQGTGHPSAGSYVSDAAGRLISMTRGGKSYRFGWDADGRLVKADVQDGSGTQSTRYSYDYQGWRRSRQGGAVSAQGGFTADPSQAVHYVWGAGDVLEEVGSQGPVAYTRGAGMALGAGSERLLHDGLASVVGRVGPGGVPTLYRWDAWGRARLDNSNYSQPGMGEASAGFAGMYAEAVLGLNYAQQRWQDPLTGNWLSEDPVSAATRLMSPMGMLAFGYANGNPARWRDPDGKCVHKIQCEDEGECCALSDEEVLETIPVLGQEHLAIKNGVATKNSYGKGNYLEAAKSAFWSVTNAVFVFLDLNARVQAIENPGSVPDNILFAEAKDQALVVAEMALAPRVGGEPSGSSAIPGPLQLEGPVLELENIDGVWQMPREPADPVSTASSEMAALASPADSPSPLALPPPASARIALPKAPPAPLALPAPAKPTKVDLQKIANAALDATRKRYGDKAAAQDTFTANLHKSGRISLTGSNKSKPGPAARQAAKEAGATDVDVKPSENCLPGTCGHHGEQRGAAYGDNIGDPVVRQASASGAKHGGKACTSCEAVQKARGIVNDTGNQSDAQK